MELMEINEGKVRSRTVENKQFINFYATQETIERKLFEEGLHIIIIAVYGDPATAPVAAAGVGFYDFSFSKRLLHSR